MSILLTPGALLGKDSGVVAITHILTVRLRADQWRQVRFAAAKRKVSYSWIVRYCLFRFLSQLSATQNNGKVVLSQEIICAANSGIHNECHRHRLCLYGSDYYRLKVMAMHLHLPLAVIVRLAITSFPDTESVSKVTDRELFWFGIRISETADFRYKHRGRNWTMAFRQQAFALATYWPSGSLGFPAPLNLV